MFYFMIIISEIVITFSEVLLICLNFLNTALLILHELPAQRRKSMAVKRTVYPLFHSCANFYASAIKEGWCTLTIRCLSQIYSLHHMIKFQAAGVHSVQIRLCAIIPISIGHPQDWIVRFNRTQRSPTANWIGKLPCTSHASGDVVSKLSNKLTKWFVAFRCSILMCFVKWN